MGRHIRWPAIITFTGIVLTLVLLGYLSLSPEPIVTTPIKIKEVYREAVAGTPQFINPLLASFNQVDQDLTALIFNGLTRPDGNGGLEPDLAESWESSDDGLNYLFRLRRGVRWQDDEPFTSADVLFTVSLMQDPEFPGAPHLHNLWATVTVQKLDDYTLRFTLTEPFPAFADFTTIGILPAHILGDIAARDLLDQPFNLKPVGTGPFKLDEVTTEVAKLSANPFYYGAQPGLKRVELHFFPTYQATITAYQAGAVEGISYIPPQAMPDIQPLESLALYTARISGYITIYLNLQTPETTPYFSDKTVRQALLHALDRQTIIDNALNGQGLVASGPIHPWSWAYNPKQPLIEFDLAQATSLLDAAGWIDSNADGIRDKDGQTFTFSLLTNDTPTNLAIADAIRTQWQQVGVAVELEVVGAGLNERLVQHNFQAALTEIRLRGDPDPYPLWHQSQIEGGQNFGGWQHEEASKLLEDGREATDTGPRNDAYYEFQEIFADELPALILLYPVYTYGVSQEVLGVQLGPLTSPSDRFRTITKWHYSLSQ